MLQVENDRDCREVLGRHWPSTPRLEDAHDVTAAHLLEAGPLDLLYGGFPCTDISNSYTRDGGIAGLAGARSGLWSQFERLTREAAPDWILIENVQNLLRANAGRDFRTILGVLDELSGTVWRGRCSMHVGSEFPSNAVVSSLSAILETEPVPPKYSITPTAARGMLTRGSVAGWRMPAFLRLALERLAR